MCCDYIKNTELIIQSFTELEQSDSQIYLAIPLYRAVTVALPHVEENTGNGDCSVKRDRYRNLGNRSTLTQ